MKQMSGAQEIELLIKGDNAAVQETFTGIAEVEKCIPLEQKDEACVHLNLIAKPGMDIREQVFASLCQPWICHSADESGFKIS